MLPSSRLLTVRLRSSAVSVTCCELMMLELRSRERTDYPKRSFTVKAHGGSQTKLHLCLRAVDEGSRQGAGCILDLWHLFFGLSFSVNCSRLFIPFRDARVKAGDFSQQPNGLHTLDVLGKIPQLGCSTGLLSPSWLSCDRELPDPVWLAPEGNELGLRPKMPASCARSSGALTKDLPGSFKVGACGSTLRPLNHLGMASGCLPVRSLPPTQ